jgi:hypothetical protein
MTLYVAFFLSEFSVRLDPLLEHLRGCFSRLLEYVPADGSDDLDCSPVIPAAAALVQGHFGKRHANKNIITENYYTYGRALKCLSRKLATLQSRGFRGINEQEWMDTTFACSMLSLWEVCSALTRN